MKAAGWGVLCWQREKNSGRGVRRWFLSLWGGVKIAAWSGVQVQGMGSDLDLTLRAAAEHGMCMCVCDKQCIAHELMRPGKARVEVHFL